MGWQIYALLALLSWGLWGFLAKVASRQMAWYEVFIVGSVSGFFMALALGFAFRPNWELRSLAFWLAFVAGAFSYLGSLFFYIAVGRGNLSLVMPLGALYPLVGLALAFLFLQERVTLTQGLGIALAVVAAVLLSRG